MGIINKSILKKKNDIRHTPEHSNFSQKDIEIIRLIGSGNSNRQIAEYPNYSEGTIRNRISAILSETGLYDRTQSALFPIKNRLV